MLWFLCHHSVEVLLFSYNTVYIMCIGLLHYLGIFLFYFYSYSSVIKQKREWSYPWTTRRLSLWCYCNITKSTIGFAEKTIWCFQIKTGRTEEQVWLFILIKTGFIIMIMFLIGKWITIIEIYTHYYMHGESFTYTYMHTHTHYYIHTYIHT